MKKLFLLMSAIILNFSQITINAQTLNSKNEISYSLTDNEKLEDLNTLYTTLEDRQKHLYDVVSKEIFNNTIKKIKDNISNLSDTGFYYELEKLTALSHDAHTFLKNDQIFSNIKQNFIPINFKQIDNKWYLVSCYGQDYEKYLSYELIKINGYSIKDILKLAEPYISYENNIRLETMFTEKLNQADFLKHLGVLNDINNISFTVLDNTEKEIEFAVKTCLWKDISDLDYFSIYKIPETKQNLNKIYEFFPLNDNSLIIRYNSAREDTSYPLNEFTKHLKKEIENKSYSKIIIDLRDNKGGNYTLFEPTIEMIKQLKQKQNFELYTLISEDTFSSGVILAAQLQHDLGAILVGTPTGGNVYFYGNTDNAVELPNSGFTVTYSTKYWQDIPGYKADTLYPDINIKHTIKDYISGIDKEVEVILNGDKLKINNPKTNQLKSKQSIIINNVELKYYDDNSAYLHDIIINNTDKIIAGYQIAMLSYDKNGYSLKQQWLGPNSKKSYMHIYNAERIYLLPWQTYEIDGGWSLFDENENNKNQTAYGIYCIKEIIFSDGKVWKNPDYDNWETKYKGKNIDIKTLKNYYPLIHTIQ